MPVTNSPFCVDDNDKRLHDYIVVEKTHEGGSMVIHMVCHYCGKHIKVSCS